MWRWYRCIQPMLHQIPPSPATSTNDSEVAVHDRWATPTRRHLHGPKPLRRRVQMNWLTRFSTYAMPNSVHSYLVTLDCARRCPRIANVAAASMMTPSMACTTLSKVSTAIMCSAWPPPWNRCVPRSTKSRRWSRPPDLAYTERTALRDPEKVTELYAVNNAIRRSSQTLLLVTSIAAPRFVMSSSTESDRTGQLPGVSYSPPAPGRPEQGESCRARAVGLAVFSCG
ncbi:hypothetical protein NONI108955_37730 [Nocardia ninae]